ncbi:MAG TPA: nitrite reductase (NAD(P)H) small subunit [Rhodobacteraceae bacterium]|jgi:nitrite reductase (NADH) small subunit|nr:nitrite reductase (NAD(P)H) small subunit [Paracoccaceae bacterium]
MSNFVEIGTVDDIPLRGARVVKTLNGDIAIFRSASNAVYAVDEYLPGKAGPLSNGIQHGELVTDPMYNWVFDLATGQAQGADEGAVKTYKIKVVDGRVLLDVSSFISTAA